MAEEKGQWLLEELKNQGIDLEAVIKQTQAGSVLVSAELIDTLLELALKATIYFGTRSALGRSGTSSLMRRGRCRSTTIGLRTSLAT